VAQSHSESPSRAAMEVTEPWESYVRWTPETDVRFQYALSVNNYLRRRSSDAHQSS